MKNLSQALACFALVISATLISTTTQADVHFVYPKDSDTLIHPNKLEKYASFKVETRNTTDDLGNSVELIYVVKTCKEKLFRSWEACKIFGPISRAKLDAYLGQTAPEKQALLADLDSVDNFYSQSEGLKLGAIQLGAMIPIVQFPVLAPFAFQARRLERLTEKMRPFALIYESQDRHVFFAKHPFVSDQDFSTRLQKEVDEIMN